MDEKALLPPFIRGIVSTCIALATFLIVLDYSIANVSLPYIAGDLGVSVDQGTYVITLFAVGNAISLPLTGWLTKRLGMIRLITISILLFTLFSWVCGISWSFPMLVTARFIQGFVSGPLIPLSQTLMVTINPKEKKNLMIALWSTVAVVGPIAGPILGGYLSYDYHWSWIFFINVPVGLLIAPVIWIFLKKMPSNTTEEPLDVAGLIFLALSMGCLQILLDRGEQFDWWRSPIIRFLGTVSLVSFIFLIVWSLKTQKPLIELRLFKIFSYSLSIPMIFVMYAIYMGSVVLVPLWLQENMGYTAIWAGLAVCSIGLAPLLLARGVARLMTRIGVKVPLMIGFAFFAFSCFYSTLFDTNIDIFHIELSRFFLGCGVAFFITPIFAFSICDVKQEDLPSATGIFHLIRAMSGAIGTSLITTLWIRRKIYHHKIMGEMVTPFTEEWDLYQRDMANQGLVGERALTFFNDVVVENQASMLAVNDCFYVMGWLFVAMIPLCLLIRKKPLPQSSMAAE